jgi:hypothetical protein
MKKILGEGKNIRALLGGAKYAVDFYQREYRWETKHISELLNDLVEEFNENYEPGHDRKEVAGYSHYFLGSIIVSNKNGQNFIVDGQQRLTSLTLLLIRIHHLLQDSDQKTQIANLIFATSYGKRSFNIDVPERTPCMEALFTDTPFEEAGQPESVTNILGRYQDITEQFPEELCGDALPYFTDWLIENVHLVEITAFSDADAYKIFETMNDRGMSLTPSDMLKGYLLANITDSDRRNEASKIWRSRIVALNQIDKEEDANAIKSWLRSQHAQTIRERKRGAEPKDFDLIGTEFHRWVGDHEQQLGLTGSMAFASFIEKDFGFYSKWYEQIRRAADTLTPSLEAIHFNAQNNFTLQYPALLAPLVAGESEDVIRKKLRVVAMYLDIVINRRIWNFKSTDYSTMQYSIFQLLILPIRGRSLPELVGILVSRLNDDEDTFAKNERFYLHGMNGRQIHRMLARLTDYVETQSGLASHYAEYVQRRGKNGYEVEHIWANHADHHQDEFSHPSDFAEHRNRIGGLLLLPKSFNASYGDMPYEQKREHYFGQNLLAKSLHDRTYSNDPGFRRFREQSGLNFRAHDKFKKVDLEERQKLYLALAERIWSPENLSREVAN